MGLHALQRALLGRLPLQLLRRGRGEHFINPFGERVVLAGVLRTVVAMMVHARPSLSSSRLSFTPPSIASTIASVSPLSIATDSRVLRRSRSGGAKRSIGFGRGWRST
jgi:hypothetical protein